MTKITDAIWLGSAHSVDARLLRESGVTAVLNVAADLKGPLGWSDGFTYAQCGLWDGPGNPLSSYYAAVFELMRLQQLRLKTLVHCHAGVSRSPFVVLCYLRTQRAASFEELEALIKDRRPRVDINPAHRERYRHLEPHLAAMKELGR